MNKDSREKAWKATAKIKTDLNNDIDISNLNSDESFAPIEEEEKEPLTEEEKRDVRKKLFFLLVVIIIVLFALLIVLFFNPFGSKTNNKNNNTENNNDEEINNENNETEEDKENKEMMTSIVNLEDGSINLLNSELQLLVKEITYNTENYYENNTLALFKTNNTNINALTNKDKLFLVSKTSDFKSLVNKQINSASTICNTPITIETSAIDKILKDRFNTNITLYDSFIYEYYEEETYITSIKFVLQNNSYIGQCYTYTTEIVNVVEQSLVSATKENNKLYIDMKVVFINKTGVYKDPTFKTLITNNAGTTFNEYIQGGNTYRYTFDVSNSNYYLENVSLLK